MTINFLRVSIAFFFLLPILPLIDKKTFHPKKSDIKQFIVVGGLMALSTSLYNIAITFAPIQNVVVINSTYPFFVMIFAWFLLKEHITKKKLLSACIAIIGLIIINPFHLDAYLLGNSIAIGAAITAGLFITYMRVVDKNHTIGSVLWYLFFASLVLSPAPFIRGFGNINEVRIYVMLIGVMSTGLTYLFFNLALEKLEAEEGAIIAVTTTPVLAILRAILFVHEQLTLRIVIGGSLLIIAGLYLELHIKRLTTKKK